MVSLQLQLAGLCCLCCVWDNIYTSNKLSWIDFIVLYYLHGLPAYSTILLFIWVILRICNVSDTAFSKQRLLSIVTWPESTETLIYMNRWLLCCKCQRERPKTITQMTIMTSIMWLMIMWLATITMKSKNLTLYVSMLILFLSTVTISYFLFIQKGTMWKKVQDERTIRDTSTDSTDLCHILCRFGVPFY